MKKTLFLILLLPVFAFGQDLTFVKMQVDTLTSPSFFGRGYIHNGSNLAADYLATQYSKLGAKPVEESFFQPFSFVVNTFPKATTVRCDGIKLQEGFDYLVDASSGSSHGKYKTVFLDSSNFQPASASPKLGKAIGIIDLAGIDTPDEVSQLYNFKVTTLKNSPLIVLNPNKTMWSVSQQRYKNTLIEIKKDQFCPHTKMINIEVTNDQVEFEARNVIGKISGISSDSCIVLTAHYDHLGMMGKAIFPGASDNASGTAMLLDLIQFYSHNKPNHDIYFISFAAEEAGLIGSKFFVDNPLFKLSKIKFLINLDLMGSAAEGITIVNGRLFSERMKNLARINTENDFLPKIKLRGKAANSDHYWFSEVGVPAVFIYTIGNANAYHDVHDLPKGLDWENYNALFTLLVNYLETL